MKRVSQATPRLALVGLLGILVLAGSAAAQDSPDDPMGVTEPVRVTADDASPSRSYQSPFVLSHPEDDGQVVAGAIEMNSGTCRLLRSQDRGQSWTLLGDDEEEPRPSPEDYPLCFKGAIYGYVNETPMAWGRDGALYWGLTGYDPQHETPDRNLSVLVARSPDLGDSWTSSVANDGLEAGGTGQGRWAPRRPVSALAVDSQSASSDIVYVGWQTYPEDSPRLPKIAVSTDGGESFSEARTPFDEDVSEELGGTGGLEGLPPQLAVDDGGTLYALFPGRPDEGDEDVPNRLLLARSEDQGETFTVTEVATTDDSNSAPTLKWSPHGGQDGSLHIVYEDRRDESPGAREIFYQRSTDGGESFTDRRQLNDDDPQKRYTHHNANLSIAPDGRVDVVWWDFRDGAPRYANDVYYTHSPDNGESWSANTRVTDQSVSRKIGPWSNNYDMRSPPGLTSTNETALVAWSDTRLANAAGQSQDIFAATVQLEELPSQEGNATLLIIVAILGGLLTGSLVLVLVALFLSRQRSRATVPRPAT